MNPEPAAEQLSAYLDHELTAVEAKRLEEHLAGCEHCRRRLQAMRATVAAVAELPTEEPPRRFALPAQRQQRPLWSQQLGWAAAAAAAVLVATLIVTHLPHPGGSGTASLGTARSTRPVPAAGYGPERAASAALPNTASAADPRHPGRRLQIGTDAATYSADQVMLVRVVVTGLPAPTTPNQVDLHLTLVRSGSGIQLPVSGATVSGQTLTYAASFRLSELNVAQPAAGDYQLTATWLQPGGAGDVLVAAVPIRIQA